MAHYKETHRGALGVDFTLILEGNDMVLHHHQDAGPILDENARLRQHQQYGTRGMGAKLVARVPLNIQTIWQQEFRAKTGHRHSERGYQDLWKAFKLAKLDEPENAKFRIDGGRLGGKTDVGKTSIAVSTNISAALRGR